MTKTYQTPGTSPRNYKTYDNRKGHHAKNKISGMGTPAEMRTPQKPGDGPKMLTMLSEEEEDIDDNKNGPSSRRQEGSRGKDNKGANIPYEGAFKLKRSRTIVNQHVHIDEFLDKYWEKNVTKVNKNPSTAFLDKVVHRLIS